MRSGEHGPAARKRPGSIIGSADASMRRPAKDDTPKARSAPRVAGRRPDRRPAPFCWVAHSPRPRRGISDRRRLGQSARSDDANAGAALDPSGVASNSDIPREVDDQTLWHDIVTNELFDDDPTRRSSNSNGRRLHRPRTLRALVASLIESGVVLAAIFAIPVIVWTLHAGQTSDSRPPRARAGPTPTAGTTGRHPLLSNDKVLAAESWVEKNLPTGSAVTADPHVAHDLAKRQLKITTAPTRLLRWHEPGYVLSTPELRSATTPRSTLAELVDSSVPVAVFGTKTDSVQLRQIAPSDVRALERVRQIERSDRRQAGGELMQNPNVSATGRAAARILAGDLDIRAETFLAVLAARTTVSVTAVPIDPNEEAIGLPARSLVVALRPADVDPTSRTLQGGYRPSSTVAAGRSATRITWNLSLTAVRPIG